MRFSQVVVGDLSEPVEKQHQVEKNREVIWTVCEVNPQEWERVPMV